MAGGKHTRHHAKAWPASAMLKSAAPNFDTSENDEYAPFTQAAATALSNWMESNVRIRVDGSDAYKRCWQLRFVAEEDSEYEGERLRVLVVNGATTMFTLTKYLAEAFGWREEGKPYIPQPSKGTIPSGSHWTIEREEDTESEMMAGIIGTQKSVYKAAGRGAPFFDEKKIFVYQLFRNRGDTLIYRCDPDRWVTVRLDGMETEAPRSSFSNHARFTPKCVGADEATLTKQQWTQLNKNFLQKRDEETFLVAGEITKEEMEEEAANRHKVPMFDNRGQALDRRNSSGRGALEEMHRVVALPFVP